VVVTILRKETRSRSRENTVEEGEGEAADITKVIAEEEAVVIILRKETRSRSRENTVEVGEGEGEAAVEETAAHGSRMSSKITVEGVEGGEGAATTNSKHKLERSDYRV
jgi:hypothetical protein